MVKQTRKKFRRPKRKSFRKKTSKTGRKARRTIRAYKKMVGGDFTQEETQQLLEMGFTQDDLQVLAGTGVRLNIIQMSLNQINPATGNPFTPQEIIQSVNEANDEINNLDVSVISNASDDDHNLDIGENLDLDDSYNDSMNTTMEDISGGGRKTRKGRKGRKHGIKSRRQRGGMCFGNGVGANNYDPNFSIYNTRELTLFPYKPTN